MSFDPHEMLHAAASRPSGPPPFERLWVRGRRRRAVRNIGGACAGIAVVVLAVSVLPSAFLDRGNGVGLEVTDQPGTTCPVTDAAAAPFTPPAPYPATPTNAQAVWYGTPELWTVVPDTPGPQKSVWWSVDFEGGATEERPEIEVVYERLDDPNSDPVVNESPGTNAHTGADGWFMINGLQPDQPGCWRVTATYRGTELSYVYLLEEPADERAEGTLPLRDPPTGATPPSTTDRRPGVPIATWFDRTLSA